MSLYRMLKYGLGLNGQLMEYKNTIIDLLCLEIISIFSKYQAQLMVHYLDTKNHYLNSFIRKYVNVSCLIL